MRIAKQILKLSPSTEDSRPQIDFTLPKNAAIDWLAVGEVTRGAPGADVHAPLHITILRSDAVDWHYYLCGGPELMSDALVELIRPFSEPHLSFLPASLNGARYYIVLPRDPLDCLDVDASQCHFFRSNPAKVMHIKKYRFQAGCIVDPKVFRIPQLRYELFATESIKDIVEDAGLRGISFTTLQEF
jgi:hypothetical protein